MGVRRTGGFGMVLVGFRLRVRWKRKMEGEERTFVTMSLAVVPLLQRVVVLLMRGWDLEEFGMDGGGDGGGGEGGGV